MAEETDKLLVSPEQLESIIKRIISEQAGRVFALPGEDLGSLERQFLLRRALRGYEPSDSRTSISTTVFSVIAAAIFTLASWTLYNVQELKTTTAVIQTDLKNVLEETKRSREAIDSLKSTVVRLETLMVRLETMNTKPTPGKVVP
jgi:hypothetical protein